jgi:dTDP-4-amino-4,6-dideoxygalactose transaminase
MLWCGLVPVFCDSEAETLAIDADDAARRITPRTRAMVIVHMWGLPCQVAKLQALADAHGLKIVEDASHAHGASADGVPCGRFGDVSVFSLQGDKLVPAGEGGVLLTDDEAIYKKAICLGDITRIIQLPMPEMRFAATSFGVKTRIAPMSAALGLAMLERLPETNVVRNRNHLALSESLEALGFDSFLPPARVERVYFEFMVRHRDPDFDTASFCARLKELGCRASAPRYPVLHQQPFFTEGHWRSIGRFPEGCAPRDPGAVHLPQIERENGRLIRLPNFCHPESAPLIEQYAEAFKMALCEPT